MSGKHPSSRERGMRGGGVRPCSGDLSISRLMAAVEQEGSWVAWSRATGWVPCPVRLSEKRELPDVSWGGGRL